MTDDLSDEGSGVDPEEQVKHELTQWIEEFGLTVYWDQANPWNYPTFSTTGSVARPDLLIPEAPIGNQGDERTLALETKPPGGSELFAGMKQTVDYYKQTARGELALLIDGEDVGQDVLAIATRESMNGRLIEHDEHRRTKWGNSTYARNRGWRPQAEFVGTASAFNTASTWVSDFAANNISATNRIGYGMLLSSCLDDEGRDDVPAVCHLDREEGKTRMRWQPLGDITQPADGSQSSLFDEY